MMETHWEPWRPFPDPRRGDMLVAPLGPGVYWLRDHRDDETVYIGEAENVAYRMSSLLPAPDGCGTRNNTALREYVHANLEHIFYRTTGCATKAEAKALESGLRSDEDCRF